MKHHLRPLAIAAAATFALVSSSLATVIQITASVTFQADTLTVVARNDGDEAALGVQVSVGSPAGSQNSRVVDIMEPGAQFRFPFLLRPPAEPGTYPLTLLIDYTDANLHPFSVPLVHLLRVGAVGRPDVFGAFEPVQLSNQTHARLHLKNQANDEHLVRARMHGAREITFAEPERVIRVGPKEEIVIDVPLANFSAIRGSRYPLYAILTYDAGGKTVANFAPGEVEIVAGSRFATTRFWIGGAVLLAAALGIASRRFLRRGGPRRARAAAIGRSGT